MYFLFSTFRYAEAHKMKLKADALEVWELEKWHRYNVNVLHSNQCTLTFVYSIVFIICIEIQ